MPDIVGTWRLVSATSLDAEGRPLPLPYGPQAIGRVVFTAEKRMMAALSDGRPELPVGGTREYGGAHHSRNGDSASRSKVQRGAGAGYSQGLA